MSERELIERAIESARCRIYRVQASAMGGSVQHQAKADDQAKLQVVTIKALEKQIPKKVKNAGALYETWGKVMYYSCPNCNLTESWSSLYKYCNNCGQKLDWGNEDAE